MRTRSAAGRLLCHIRPPPSRIKPRAVSRAAVSLVIASRSSRSFACIAASSTGRGRAVDPPREPNPARCDISLCVAGQGGTELTSFFCATSETTSAARTLEMFFSWAQSPSPAFTARAAIRINALASLFTKKS